jgi:bifunctional non-homologous end joining protein LigD
VDDVTEALAKGDLKLRLDGYKLKGSWVLVRTRGWGGPSGARPADPARSWLLIKHRDDWSGPIDITTFAPHSVKTGGGFRDILLQEAPGVWRSNPQSSGPQGADALRRIAEKVIALEEAEAAPDGQTQAAAADPQPDARPARRAVRRRPSPPATRRKDRS